MDCTANGRTPHANARPMQPVMSISFCYTLAAVSQPHVSNNLKLPLSRPLSSPRHRVFQPASHHQQLRDREHAGRRRLPAALQQAEQYGAGPQHLRRCRLRHQRLRPARQQARAHATMSAVTEPFPNTVRQSGRRVRHCPSGEDRVQQPQLSCQRTVSLLCFKLVHVPLSTSGDDCFEQRKPACAPALPSMNCSVVVITLQ